MKHEPNCSYLTGGQCDCIAAEEALIERASMPDPAELIRRAKARGLITKKQAYVPGQSGAA